MKPRTNMKHGEDLAEKYLRHLGYSDIEHEPDKNRTPDFLIKGEIAVEVTFISNDTRSSIPWTERLQKLLRKIEPPNFDASWYVNLSLNTVPISSTDSWYWKKRIAPKIKAKLAEFSNSKTDNGSIWIYEDEFEINLYRTSKSPTRFIAGVAHEGNRGGWVAVEIEKNVARCVEKKSKSAIDQKHKYPEWWLVLIDNIAYGRDPGVAWDKNILRPDVWDRIVLVDPTDHTHAFRIL